MCNFVSYNMKSFIRPVSGVDNEGLMKGKEVYEYFDVEASWLKSYKYSSVVNHTFLH